MNARPHTIAPHASLADAARLMWDRDCGWAPVVDDTRVVGVITDRDICMAAYTRGMTLRAMVVAGTMSTNVHSVGPHDRLADAMLLMRQHRVRRVPVIDASGALVGIVSLTDLVREAAAAGHAVAPADVVATLAAICEPPSE